MRTCTALACCAAVVVERLAEKQLFLGRMVPLVLSSAVLVLLGVLAVDLYIEHRQVDASTQVAQTTISTSRVVGEFGGAIERYEEAVTYAAPNEPSALAVLGRVRDRLVLAMKDFEPHVSAADRPTWESLRERLDAAPLEPGIPATAAHQLIRALEEDLAATASIVDTSGLADLGASERLHTLHGALEACVILLMAGLSLAVLFRWGRQEERERTRDALVEEQLRRALVDLEGFAARVAHDLRLPLQPILMGSQTIERAPVSDAVRMQAARIERSAQRLSGMIEALLQYTRASVGATLASEAPLTDLNVAVEEIVGDFGDMARARGARIATDLGPDVALACSREVVRSIVSNLVDNALKYGAKEGAPPRLTVRTRVEGSYGVIEVEDAGPGIDPELRERVFHPLFRGQGGGVGIGLGLSIVQRLVETQRGRIELRDGKEGGALFRVLLPAASAASMERPRDAGEGSRPAQPDVQGR